MKTVDDLEVDLSDPAVFARAVSALKGAEQSVRTNNFAVAIATLIHRPTSSRSREFQTPGGSLLEADKLEALCDDTWRKADSFLPVGAQGPIYKPFSDNFKPESSSSANNWRNSFAPQTGLGCDAPPTIDYLLSPDFVSEARYYCPLRDAETGACTSAHGPARGKVCFNPGKSKGSMPPGPFDTAAAMTPKILARADGGYWFIPQSSDSLIGLLNEPTERVPVLAFAVALYAGSDYLGRTGRQSDLSMTLQQDLGLDDESFFALFDGSLSSVGNIEIVSPGLVSPTPAASPQPAPPSILTRPGRSGRRVASELPLPRTFEQVDPAQIRVAAGATADPAQRADLLERASQGHQHVLNLLSTLLEQAGYACQSQPGGFDLVGVHATHGAHLFEVKTWTEFNLPKQTRSGWAQLYEYRYRNRYLLGPGPVSLYLVFDRAVPLDHWAWNWLVSEMNVRTCWIGSDGQMHTLAGHESKLPPGLG